MSDILDKLNDLHQQATTEQSHYYVAATVKEAALHISNLEASLKTIKAMLVGKNSPIAASIRAVADACLR